MKKKLGIILFAVAIVGGTFASAASAGPQCIRVGNLWFCEY